MGKLIALKSFDALSFDQVEITEANRPDVPPSDSQLMPESVDDSPAPLNRVDQMLRESLRRRYTAPFQSAIPYQRGGLNE